MPVPSSLWGPLIALAGTVAVALLAFYQWRKQNANPNRAANAAARREAYENLWQKLEEINLDLRKRRGNNPQLFHLLREINIYFISHSIHFEDSDQVIINKYIAAMSLLREKIYTTDDADVADAFQKTLVEIPKTLDAELQSAAERVKRLRSEVKRRVQRVVASV